MTVHVKAGTSRAPRYRKLPCPHSRTAPLGLPGARWRLLWPPRPPVARPPVRCARWAALAPAEVVPASPGLSPVGTIRGPRVMQLQHFTEGNVPRREAGKGVVCGVS
jgi:hypothetical protein